jgi:uncharacterized protein YidB (DUF937 family)
MICRTTRNREVHDMGFLDHLMGDAKTALAGHESTLAPMLLSLVGGGDSQAAQTSGVGGLVGRFKQAGLGNIVESWVSNEQPNKQVTPDQVQSALGEQDVSALAGKTGLPKGALLVTLATLLPKLIDSMTPNGEVPKTATDVGTTPDQTPGEAEAPASTEGTAAAAGIGQTDQTEPVQSAAGRE